MVTKDQLAKGTLVRVSPTVIAQQNAIRADWRREAGDRMVMPLPDLPLDQAFEVSDPFTRKTYNRPECVGLRWPDRGISFAVLMADITEVVA